MLISRKDSVFKRWRLMSQATGLGGLQELTNFLKVIAENDFLTRIAQYISRMHGGQGFGVSVIKELAVDFDDAFFDAQHRAGGR